MSKEIKCTYCWGEVLPGQATKTYKDKFNGKVDYYHASFDDCSDAMTSGRIRTLEERRS